MFTTALHGRYYSFYFPNKEINSAKLMNLPKVTEIDRRFTLSYAEPKLTFYLLSQIFPREH